MSLVVSLRLVDYLLGTGLNDFLVTTNRPVLFLRGYAPGALGGLGTFFTI